MCGSVIALQPSTLALLLHFVRLHGSMLGQNGHHTLRGRPLAVALIRKRAVFFADFRRIPIMSYGARALTNLTTRTVAFLRDLLLLQVSRCYYGVSGRR